MKIKWTRFIPAIVILSLLAGGAALYISRYYRADVTALAALEPDECVQITSVDYGWFFDGPSDDTALIFYPGGKVDETAYAPLLRRLAEEGVDVCLVSVPARLAILDSNKAARVLQAHDYPYWYIGGHSLGGVCAASFASEHSGELEGLILLASYPTKKLDERLRVLSIYGSEDGILNREKYEKSKRFLPASHSECVLQGGNHAQFGAYGFQKGDGVASIAEAVQVEETVHAIMDFTGKSRQPEFSRQ